MWLRKNIDGRESGEIIYLYVSTWQLFPDHGWSSVGEQLVDLMDEAIQLGYSEPSVFHLRARGHIISGNYGMAVKDIDKALTNIDQQNADQIVELLLSSSTSLV